MWSNNKRKNKDLQKTKVKLKKKYRLVRGGEAELDVCNLIAIRQLLWIFRRIILESDWMEDMNSWFTLWKKHMYMWY